MPSIIIHGYGQQRQPIGTALQRAGGWDVQFPNGASGFGAKMTNFIAADRAAAETMLMQRGAVLLKESETQPRSQWEEFGRFQMENAIKSLVKASNFATDALPEGHVRDLLTEARQRAEEVLSGEAVGL